MNTDDVGRPGRLRSLVTWLAGCAVLLAACGGASRSTSATAAQTVAAAAVTTSTTQTTQTTHTATTLTAAKKAKPAVTAPSAPKPGTTTSDTTATTQTHATVARAKPKPPIGKVITQIQPTLPPGASSQQSHGVLACFNTVGLANGRLTLGQSWEAIDRLTTKPVFVDGPYKKHSDAVASANSLSAVADAQPAGRFVVSAPLASHLAVDVKDVAQCLIGGGAKGSGSKGSQSF